MSAPRRIRRFLLRGLLPALSAVCFPLSPAIAHAGTYCDATGENAYTGEELHLELRIDTPADGSLLLSGTPCPGFVAVTGVASALGLPVAFDAYVAIDGSGSTRGCSGIDVDGDGRLGRNDVHGSCDDSGDTIFRAEILAAERLMDRLQPGDIRVGIAVFSDGNTAGHPSSIVRELALTSDEDVVRAELQALKSLRPAGATDFEGPQDHLRGQLELHSSADRHRMLLFVSDGAPTYPAGSPNQTDDEDTHRALAAAGRLADAGVALHTFAIGADAGSATLERMAAITGGNFARADRAGDLVDLMPSSLLTGIDSLKVENLSLGISVTPVIGSLGDFLTSLPVRPGLNEILVTASTELGDVVVPCPVQLFLACSDSCAPRTHGFWRRQCKSGPSQHVSDFAELRQGIEPLLGFAEQSACEALVPLPAFDPCEKAVQEYGTLLLNIAGGQLGAGCALRESKIENLLGEDAGVAGNVSELMSYVEDLLREGLAGDVRRCQQVNDIAGAVNSGAALEGGGGARVGLLIQSQEGTN